MVFNKVDAFTYDRKDEDDLTPSTKANISLEEWKNVDGKRFYMRVYIDFAKENFNQFRSLLYDVAKDIHAKRFPYNHFLY